MGYDTEADLELLGKLRDAKITKHFTDKGQIVDEAIYDDNATQLKALELTLKLKGHIKSDGLNINVNNIDNSKHHSQVLVFGDTNDKVDEIYDTGTDGRNTNDIYATESKDGNRCKEKI